MFRGLEPLSTFEQVAVWAVLAIAVFGLVYAFWLRRQILAQETGTDEMRKYWNFIRAGAQAYLGQQFRTIAVAIGVLAVLLFLSVLIIPPTPQSREVWGENAVMAVAIGRSVAFLIGASFSYLVGAIGMNVAVQANIRVAAASRRGYNGAMQTAYRSGTVTGMLCVGLGLLGGTIIFLFYGVSAPDALLGFGFGGSLIALFMRVGGGIYTKAADVGADLVGKVEANLPEDDPRNAAVIADLVGDNVGDCAGMAADVFESFEVTIVSALILGIVLGGVGLVGIGVGTYFGLRTFSQQSVVEENCDDRYCNQEGLEAEQEARRAAPVSTIAFAAGGALLAGGVVLLLLSSGEPDAPDARVVRKGAHAARAGLWVAPQVGWGSAGLRAGGTW